MSIPYSSGQSTGVANSASTVNDLGGMNFSTLNDNELMKRVDSNNVGGSGILAIEAPAGIGTVSSHLMSTNEGGNVLASFLSQTDSVTNDYTLQLKAKAGNSVTSGLTIKDDGSSKSLVGINVADPEEVLDINGNLQLRDGDIQYQLTSGTQIVELDGSQDGTNGGKFIVKTKVDGGIMSDKLTISNTGTATLNGVHVAQGYVFAKYGIPRNVERLKTTKEEILSSDSVSQSLADPNKSEPISCQGLLDCAASAVIASTDSNGYHTLPPSGATIAAHLSSLSRIITSVKKTASQSFTSGGVTKITGWDTPHVDIGTTGWSNANSRYTIQRTARFRYNCIR